MKIAVLTDVHSNLPGLTAALEDIARQKPDIIVGAGDMVGCSAYPRAPEVWKALQEQNIPWVLGNEEERILDFYRPEGNPDYKTAIRFQPLQFRARQFSRAEIENMGHLPLSLVLPGPTGQDVFVCHASPGSMRHSPMLGIDATMERAIEAVDAAVIVVGHLHTPWHLIWREKLIIMAGSAGLPLRGKLDEVDYLLLEHRCGAWQFAYKSVQYDCEAAIRQVIQSDFLEQGGPIGWLMFDEILTQQDRLVPFFSQYCPVNPPEDIETWRKLAQGYLEQVKRWDVVKPYLR